MKNINLKFLIIFSIIVINTFINCDNLRDDINNIKDALINQVDSLNATEIAKVLETEKIDNIKDSSERRNNITENTIDSKLFPDENFPPVLNLEQNNIDKNFLIIKEDKSGENDQIKIVGDNSNDNKVKTIEKLTKNNLKIFAKKLNELEKQLKERINEADKELKKLNDTSIIENITRRFNETEQIVLKSTYETLSNLKTNTIEKIEKLKHDLKLDSFINDLKDNNTNLIQIQNNDLNYLEENDNSLNEKDEIEMREKLNEVENELYEKIDEAQDQINKIKTISDINSENLIIGKYTNIDFSYENNFDSSMNQEQKDKYFMNIAFDEALKSQKEGGVPVGSVLVKGDIILSAGHNIMNQANSPVLHAEMETVNKVGVIGADGYHNCTIYTTLSPCRMCASMINLFGIPRVVIGDNINFIDDDGEVYLRNKGLDINVLNSDSIINMMREYIKNNKAQWTEDIGKSVKNLSENLRKNITEYKHEIEYKKDQYDEKSNNQIDLLQTNSTDLNLTNQVNLFSLDELLNKENFKDLAQSLNKTLNNYNDKLDNEKLKSKLNDVTNKINSKVDEILNEKGLEKKDREEKAKNYINEKLKSLEDSFNKLKDIKVEGKNGLEIIQLQTIDNVTTNLHMSGYNPIKDFKNTNNDIKNNTLEKEYKREQSNLKNVDDLNKTKYEHSFFSNAGSFISNTFNSFWNPIKEYYYESEDISREEKIKRMYVHNNWILLFLIIIFYILIVSLSFAITNDKLRLIKETDNNDNHENDRNYVKMSDQTN